MSVSKILLITFLVLAQLAFTLKVSASHELCYQQCPSGFINDGNFCKLADYSRGAGYQWQYGDPLNDSGMYRRCENQYGKGNCEKFGNLVFPKCRSGFSPYGCCICRPAKPNCAALGMNAGNTDLSCAKKVIAC